MVQIIPKPAPKSPAWQNILFYFSCGVLFAAVLGFFFLDRSVKKSDATLKKLEGILSQKKTAEEIDLEKTASDAEKKIKQFSRLIGQHIYPSNFFGFLEKITHPKVWLTQIGLDAVQGIASFSGEAESFNALGQQLLLFEESPSLEKFSLDSIAISKEKKVVFSISLFIKPSLFVK